MNRKSTNCVFINYTVRGDENALNIFGSIMLKKNSFNFTLKRKKENPKPLKYLGVETVF